MALPKLSTGALNIYADPLLGSATSPTTSPAASSKPEDSDPNYTLNYEEPANGNLIIRQRGAQSKIPLLPIISDGQIISLGLALANKDKAWVKQQLKEQGYSSAKHIYLGELVDGKLEVVPYK